MNLLLISIPYILLAGLFAVDVLLILQARGRVRAIKRLKQTLDRIKQTNPEKDGFLGLMSRFLVSHISAITNAASTLEPRQDKLLAATTTMADGARSLLTISQRLPAAPAAAPTKPAKPWLVWLPVAACGVIIVASHWLFVANGGALSSWAIVVQASFFIALGIGLYIGVSVRQAYKRNYLALKKQQDDHLARDTAKNQLIQQTAASLTGQLATVSQLAAQLPDGEVKQYIAQAQARLEQFVKHLTHVADVILPSTTVPFVAFRFSVLLAQAQSIVSNAAQDKRIAIIPAGFDDVTLVSQQPAWLVQILATVLDNAIRYSQMDGQIEVGATVRDGTGFIKVTDRGPGITSDKMVELFQPFSHAQAPTHADGLGFNLYFDRLLAVTLGGELHIESRAGQGATVTVRFPLQ